MVCVVDAGLKVRFKRRKDTSAKYTLLINDQSRFQMIDSDSMPMIDNLILMIRFKIEFPINVETLEPYFTITIYVW